MLTITCSRYWHSNQYACMGPLYIFALIVLRIHTVWKPRSALFLRQIMVSSAIISNCHRQSPCDISYMNLPLHGLNFKFFSLVYQLLYRFQSYPDKVSRVQWQSMWILQPWLCHEHVQVIILLSQYG